MDIFNHGLWSYAIFFNHKAKDKLAAVAFGTLPDVVAFAPATAYSLFTGKLFVVPFADAHAWVFPYAYAAYNYSHSLVIFAAAFFVVWAIRRKPYLPMLMWGLHILMDIPTHPNFFPTPMFFPLSSYHFPWGISWHDPLIFFPNYALLIMALIFLWLRARKKKKNLI